MNKLSHYQVFHSGRYVTFRYHKVKSNTQFNKAWNRNNELTYESDGVQEMKIKFSASIYSASPQEYLGQQGKLRFDNNYRYYMQLISLQSPGTNRSRWNPSNNVLSNIAPSSGPSIHGSRDQSKNVRELWNGGLWME